MTQLKSRWPGDIRILKRVGFSILFLVFSIYGMNLFLNHKLNAYLKNDLPPHVELYSQGFHYNIFNSTITSDSILINIKNDNLDELITQVSLAKLSIGHIKLFPIIFNSSIDIREVQLTGLKIIHHPYRIGKDSIEKPGYSFEYEVRVRGFEVINGQLAVTTDDDKRDELQVAHCNISISEMAYHADSIYGVLPFGFEDLNMKAHDVRRSIGKFEDLAADKVTLQNDSLHIARLSFYTIYNRSDYANQLTNSRTHYDVKAEEVNVIVPRLETIEDVLNIGGEKVIIKKANAIFHKDQTIQSVARSKELYGERIRKMDSQLGFDKIEILDSRIEYGEKTGEGKEGILKFGDLYASLYNVGNIYSTPTTIAVKTEFMDDASVDVDWKFDTNDASDVFTFKAKVGSMQASSLDTFMDPAMNMRLEGNLKQTHLEIVANKIQSSCMMEIEYDRFRINMLTDNNKVKKILSSLANLLVDENSHDSGEGVQVRKTTTTQRDVTWGYWKYVWESIFTSLKECVKR